MALAADIMIDKIIELLRSAKGDEDILKEKSFDRKPGIIKFFINNGLEYGWDFMTTHFPSIVRKLIFYEVIDYCKQYLGYGDGKDLRSFAKLDEDTIFNLIMECICYCRKAYLIRQDNLYFEFDMLINTLTIGTTKRTDQANVRSTSMDSNSIDISPDALLGNCLLDTLLIHNHADQAKKRQENQEYGFKKGPREKYLKLPKLFGDFSKYVEIRKLVVEGENQDAENFVINEGACADLKPSPDVDCSDILGRFEENTDNSSCDEDGERDSYSSCEEETCHCRFQKNTDNSRFDEDGEDDDSSDNSTTAYKFAVYAAGIKPCPPLEELYRNWVAKYHSSKMGLR